MTFGMNTAYPDDATRERIVAAARALLLANRSQGTRVIEGRECEYLYTRPSPLKYPHQWLWDSSFHAIVASRFDPEAAKREVAGLFHGMRASGFMSNMILWHGPGSLPERLGTRLFVRGMTSNITQPPVIAIAVEEVYRNTQDLEFVRRYLPLVQKYYQWLATHRDPDGDELVSVIHPWETGIDATPAFDSLGGIAEARPHPLRVYRFLYGLLLRHALLCWDEERILAGGTFDVEHVLFNCIYAQGLRSISRLSALCGHAADTALYAARADRVEQAIVELCWDGERALFFDVAAPGQRQLKASTISALFPIILDTIPADMLDALVRTHLLNESEFWLPFPVPSVSAQEPAFNPGDNALLWRGPTWINTNWFLVRGLRKHGYADVARELAARSIALVDRAGFREFYDPYTGAGCGEQSFGWSTLVVDMLDQR